MVLTHHGALGGRELGLKAQAPALVGPPPPTEPGLLGIADVLYRLGTGRVGPAPDAPGGHTPGPPHEARLGLCRGKAGELDHLVDPERTGGERLAQAGKGLEGMGRDDPAVGLPGRDPLAHREPVGHVPRTRVLPGLTPIGLGDQAEEATLGTGDVSMERVDAGDQCVGVVVHPDLNCVGGEGDTHHTERMFDCPDLFRRCRRFTQAADETSVGS
jgi:hypothetical protein